mgnify:FL=1
MTKQEMLKKYNVPAELLDKYEKIKKCTSYTDKDIENISMIMTLYDAGFDNDEVKKYISLCLCNEDTAVRRTEILAKLGNSGIEVSKLCVGCMSFGKPFADFHEWTLSPDETEDTVRHAFNL